MPLGLPCSQCKHRRVIPTLKLVWEMYSVSDVLVLDVKMAEAGCNKVRTVSWRIGS